jgi:inner membrane protein
MPSPVGHILAGVLVSRVKPSKPSRSLLLQTAFCIFMANAPDLDLLPGLLQNQPLLFHGDFMHSLFVGLLVSLAAATVVHWLAHQGKAALVLGSAAYASHLLMDWTRADGRLPYGIPLFWPFSSRYFIAPIQLFPGFRHGGVTTAATGEFIRGILDWGNIQVIFVEIVLIIPLILLVEWMRRCAENRASSRSVKLSRYKERQA